MAQVVPFRGYRYSADKIHEIGDVVTQPYDKISPEMYREYLERHPQNMVHIIKNRDHQDARIELTPMDAKRRLETGRLALVLPLRAKIRV